MEEMNTIQQLIKDHPDALSDHNTLNALLLDYFPTDKLTRNILLMVYDEGFLNEMTVSKEIDSLMYNRYISALVKDYGVDSKLAEEAVISWATALHVRIDKSAINTDIEAKQKLNIIDTANNAHGTDLEITYNEAMTLMNSNKFAKAAWLFKNLNNYRNTNELLSSIPGRAKKYIIMQADSQMVTKNTTNKAFEYFQAALNNASFIASDINTNLKPNRDSQEFEGLIGADQLMDYIDEYCIPSLIDLYILSDETLFLKEVNSCIDKGKDAFKKLAECFWNISEEIETCTGVISKVWLRRIDYEILSSILDILGPWTDSTESLARK